MTEAELLTVEEVEDQLGAAATAMRMEGKRIRATLLNQIAAQFRQQEADLTASRLEVKRLTGQALSPSDAREIINRLVVHADRQRQSIDACRKEGVNVSGRERGLEETNRLMDVLYKIASSPAAPEGEGEGLGEYLPSGLYPNKPHGFTENHRIVAGETAGTTQESLVVAGTDHAGSRAVMVPNGWVVVPRRPTPEMFEAHYIAHEKAETVFADAAVVWWAMIDAAPPPPAQHGEEER